MPAFKPMLFLPWTLACLSMHAATTSSMSPWLMQPTTSDSHPQYPSFPIAPFLCPLRLTELGIRRLINTCKYALSFYQSILCGTIEFHDCNTHCSNFPASKSVLAITSSSLSAIMNIFQWDPHMTGQWDNMAGCLYHGASEMVFWEHD
ncbi:hypothetical protein EDC04DRAFT_2610681 [Pisolithus marmoratus]|nr:hypothetical protein EDC04DRAFT_2610681 [Pisolithus marmoratus]